MNVFQSQLVFSDGKTMAQKHNDGETLPAPRGVKVADVPLAPSPQVVTIEEFERERRSK